MTNKIYFKNNNKYFIKKNLLLFTYIYNVFFLNFEFTDNIFLKDFILLILHLHLILKDIYGDFFLL